MKVLCLSDEENRSLWDFYNPEKLKGIDLIISCGDLKSSYLTFLVTMGRAPLLYVHGNHDEHYLTKPPEGCDCIDDCIVRYNGLRILGLGGCLRYHPGPYQYSERQMRRRIRRLRFALWRYGGVDIVVTHAPPRELGDLDDPAHLGFEALVQLLDKYHPKYLLHGHVHLNYQNGTDRILDYNGTQIINCYDRFLLDLPTPCENKDVKYLTRPPKEEES
ncbi:MAG: metallophosphoesterase family protein [bacterium]